MIALKWGVNVVMDIFAKKSDFNCFFLQHFLLVNAFPVLFQIFAYLILLNLFSNIGTYNKIAVICFLHKQETIDFELLIN